MDPLEFAAVVARHHHVLGPAAREELSLSETAWGRLLRRDEVQRPFRGVGVLDGASDAALTRARAARAAVRCEAVLTGWSAAHLHGLKDAAPTVVHLLMRHGAGVTRRRGLRVTETSVFPGRLEERHGIPVVPVARMLADLAATTTIDALLDLAVDARFAGRLGRGDLDGEVTARRRFPGRRRLRDLAVLLRDDSSDSGFEHAARGRLTDLGSGSPAPCADSEVEHLTGCCGGCGQSVSGSSAATIAGARRGRGAGGARQRLLVAPPSTAQAWPVT